jgi:putative autoinducer-2 (AI-2) aldolase
LGRNIWKNEYPVAMIKAIRAIIHNNATASEADQLFTQLKTGK